ncbi:MAG: glycerol-3-phosphate 1-O-acyltransferase PlsY [Sedimentisphaerales bacterium]|nr:glycerol-3-phosphate 1-O-acyltransferase PlsY [Sedimentisphaerales bacterium]
MMTLIIVLIALAGYLVGSIPFGLMIGLSKGVDIRRRGSGNIGSTNVARLLGRGWGYICFVLDVAKGLLPVLAAGYYLRRQAAEVDQTQGWTWQIGLLCVAAATILGHMFSLYLRFRGGKGAATSLGAVLGIWPYFTFTAVPAFLVWLAVWGMWRYVSLASIVAAAVFPVLFGLFIWRLDGWYLQDLWPLVAFSCLMALLVILRHRGNIARLRAGTESRGGARRTSP